MHHLTDEQAAMKRQTHHQFVRGLGYVNHGAEPPVPPAAIPSYAVPPEGTADGSLHILNPSHNAPPMTMGGVAAEKAWRHPHDSARGNRMAWTAVFLGRSGWAYVGPAPKDNGKKR